MHKSAYRGSIAICHFVMTSACVTCFVLGYEFSKGSDGDSSIPYFFPAMVLAVLNALCLILVIIKLAAKQKSESISRVHQIYNFIISFGCVWALLGTIFASASGLCISATCYHTRNTWENRGIAIAIMVLHFLCLLLFIKLLMSKERAVTSNISPHPVPKINITMRTLKTQTGQTNISRSTETKDEPREHNRQGIRTSVPSPNKSRLNKRPLGRSLSSSILTPLPQLKTIDMADLVRSNKQHVNVDQSTESRKRRIALKLKAMQYLKQTRPGKIPVIQNTSGNNENDGRNQSGNKALNSGDFNKNQRFDLKTSKIYKKTERQHGKKSNRQDDKEEELETARLLQSLQRRLENLERMEETEDDMTDTKNDEHFYPKPPPYNEAITPRYTTEPMRREKSEVDIINPYQVPYRPQPGHAESIQYPHNIYESGTAYPDADIVVMHPTPLKRQSNLSSYSFSDKY